MTGPITVNNRLKIKNPLQDANATELLVRNSETKEVSSLPKESFFADINNEIQSIKNPDIVLKSVTPTIEGLNISAPADSFEWRITQVVFDNTPALSATLTPASDGFYRKDALLGTNTNSYLIVEGIEGDESVAPPTVFPIGTILLGVIDVFGNTVGGFSINDTSRTYVYGNGGATDYVEVTKPGTTLEIRNATSLTGFTIPAKNIQYGKDYYLRNSTGGLLTLKSATGTNGIRFYFPEGDLVVPVNNNVHLKYLSNGEFGGLGYLTLVGVSYKAVDIYQPNVLISSVPPTRNVNTFTYPALGYDALINNIRYKNSDAFTTTIAATVTTNLKRTDLIYITTSGVIGKKVGIESATVAVRPDLNANEVAISFINVFGNTIETPTLIDNEVSIQDAQGNEKFKIKDYLRFESVSFNASQKMISIDSLVPLSAFLDPINGNDSTGAIENSKKPFKTIEALFTALPTFTGETYSLYITGGTIPILRKMPMRNLRFVAYTATTLSFTNCMEADGVTHVTGCLAWLGIGATWTFENGNISIACAYVGRKELANTSTGSKGLIYKGFLNEMYWMSIGDGASPPLGTPIGDGTDIIIKKLYDSPQNRSNMEPSGTCNIVINEYIASRRNTLSVNGGTWVNVSVEIKKVSQAVVNATVQRFNAGKLKIGDVTLTGTVGIGSFTVEFNGTLSASCMLDIKSGVVRGTVVSTLYNTNGYNSAAATQRFENFSGKLNRMVAANGSFTFSNCIIQFDDFLIDKSTNRQDILFFEGFNTLLQNNTSNNLVTSTPEVNPLVTISDKGQISTNMTSFGTNATYVKGTATFKEKLNEIVVRSKKDLAGLLLSSATTYIIDGQITLLSGEYIEVPVGGLTIVGYGFDVSQINKNVAGQSIFISPVGGSGNLVTKDMQYTSGLGSVFDIQDSSGDHAIEMNDVNFIGCASIGKFKGYRQFTGTTCGIYSCKDGVQISGNWSGFKLTNSNIINFIAGGTLIKKDVDTLFSNRLYLDLNFSCQTGAIFSDFTDSNFASSELFQINNTLATLNGSKDASINTPLLLPNITPSNSKARFTNNLGITNSAMKFQDLKSPDGNTWRLAVDNTGNITTTIL